MTNEVGQLSVAGEYDVETNRNDNTDEKRSHQTCNAIRSRGTSSDGYQPKHAAESATKKPQKASPTSVWSDLGSLGLKIGIIAMIALLIFTFVYSLHYNTDPGMSPAVKDGDLVICYRLDKDYRPGDAILVSYRGHTQVRRVIARAGDTVDITEEGLVINGALQQEQEIYQKTERYQDGVSFPLTVPEGQVFVLGDNRTGATDSRIYGCVKIENALGKVMTVIRRRSI